jgi:hypothetical protein
MLHLLTIAWPLSVRLTCWLSRRRVMAIDRARERVAVLDSVGQRNVHRETTGTVTFSCVHPWARGADDDDDWLEPVEDLTERERRYDA